MFVLQSVIRFDGFCTDRMRIREIKMKVVNLQESNTYGYECGTHV